MAAAVIDPGGNIDQLTNIENINGTNFDDEIVGDSGPNTLNGYDGNDILDGGAGDDIINGGPVMISSTMVVMISLMQAKAMILTGETLT